MLEESIDASPSSLQHSLRKKRERRKTKRVRLYESSTSISNTSVFLNDETNISTSQLAAMCWDSDQDEDSKNLKYSMQSKQLNNYERFKKENMLAAADRNTFQITKTVFKPTQIFQTCEKLLETQYLTCDNHSQRCLNLQSEWISKSFVSDKLLKAATVEEKLNETLRSKSPLNSLAGFELDTTFLDNAVLTQRPTPETAKTNNAQSIVDRILKDFCSSLDSSEEDEREIGDFEPFFRFRRKKIRTYERSYHKPQLLNSKVPAPLHCEDIDISDTSSELSIQEGNSQIIPAAEPLALDKTGPLHNNLLNLSAYFTQNLLESEGNDSVENACSPTENSYDRIKLIHEDISRQIQKILTLRIKYEHFSNAVFHGVPNDLRGFTSPVEDTARVSRTEGNTTQSVHVEDLKGTKTAESIGSLRAQINYNKNEEPSVFNEDNWQHDSDFFANFQTQNVLKTSKTSTPALLLKSKQKNTTLEPSTFEAITPQKSKNPVDNNILETQINVDEVLQLFENPTIGTAVESRENGNAWKCDFENIIFSEWQLDDIQFENESNNEKVKSNETTLDDAAKNGESSKSLKNECDNVREALNDPDILVDLFDDNDFWNETFTQVKTIQEKALKTEQANLNEKDNKVTKINEKKIEKFNEASEHILSQPTTSHQALLKLKMAERNQNIKAQKATTIIEPFIGFRTGNLKIIHFTEESLKKGQHIFENLPELPHRTENNNTKTDTRNCENKQCSEKNIKTKNSNSNAFENSKKVPMHKTEAVEEVESFIGFRTGNSKIIQITEEALKKGEHILEHLPELSKITGNNKETAKKSPQKFVQLANQMTDSALQETNNKVRPSSIEFVGFETASCKSIKISEKARKKYENHFANIFDEALSDTIKNQNQNFSAETVDSKKQHIACEKYEFSNIQLSEWIPSGLTPPNKLAFEQKSTHNKRKFENVESSMSVFEKPAKLLCKSETMHEKSYHNTKSVTVKSCSSHVLKTTKAELGETTSNIIVRKNLLSLSKTRKMRLKQTNHNNCNNAIDSTNNVETPVKLMAATKFSEISKLKTPNASEFFECIIPSAASTPQQQKFATDADVRTPVRSFGLRKTENLDSDFQRINWEQIDDSKATSTCETPSCQKSSLQHLPSPQERIENLSSCGDPPPIPKIVNSNTSRRFLGLSRKSILKK